MAEDPSDASMMDYPTIDLKQVVFSDAKEICLRGKSILTDKESTIEEILSIYHDLLDVDDESDGLFRSRKEFFYLFLGLERSDDKNEYHVLYEKCT